MCGDVFRRILLTSCLYVENFIELDRRTADVVKGIADSITQMLVWTTDFPSANSSGRIPILDIE